MRTYEVLFILHSQLTEVEVTDHIAEFRKIAEDGGAKFVSEDPWGKRRLAYPINKMNDGIYHLFVFEAEAQNLSELDRKMKNSEKVMRHLIVRTDLMQKRATKLALKNPKKERQARSTSPATTTTRSTFTPIVAAATDTPTTTTVAAAPDTPTPTVAAAPDTPTTTEEAPAAPEPAPVPAGE